MPMIKLGQSTYNNVTHQVVALWGFATRDAEDKPINGTEHAVASIAIGEDKEGVLTYVSLNGWRENAALVRKIAKGDSIHAVGKLKPREYNGKQYFDLDADFVVKSGAGFAETVDYFPDLPDDFPPETKATAADGAQTLDTLGKRVKENTERPKEEDFAIVDGDDLPF